MRRRSRRPHSRRTMAARWPTSGRSKPGDDKKDLWCGVEPASLFRSRDGGDSWEMVAGHQQPRARAQVAARQRRAVHAHHPSRRQARAPGHLHRRPLPERGRRRDLPGVEQGRRRRLRARSVSRVRPVRPQDRAPPRCARPALHAEPRRLGRLDRSRRPAARHRRPAQRRPRPHLAIDRQGAAFRFRLPHRRPSARRRHGLRGAARAYDADLPGGAPAVWRSENGGDSWSGSPAGCRRRRATSRSCATRWTSTSSRSPALYFGTTTGQLWIGRDGGEDWECLFDALPPIHCVKVAVV